ncbi:hypothetical protein Pnap_5000 (plasmid) [Polaromonas naphthalenivorans CJ2]|uniref:Uncharacterized protein n=2 Tax=Polaromonas naphthalenivorans TaxID=216465 RepID=A1VX70_POLNA|nr:hypothetical protein Pnap_5000 [Polaromonas naphthalenivorans CJ2]
MARRPPVRAKRATTARKMAERFNCSIRTVMRAIALPREEYLASHTVNRSKPWEALGMSRATWYRKGKPLDAPANPKLEEVA